ncbi:TPA: gp53-like domain-containing protein [Citrobacter youngae]
MLRIGQVETSATADGKYTDGSVAGGIAATRLRAAAFNAIQEELANIVESAGMTLSPDDMTQVLAALKKQFLSRTHPFADIKADGAAAIAEALSNLGFGSFSQYQTLGDGQHIFQHGTGGANSSGIADIVFPKAFTTTSNLNVTATATSQQPANYIVTVGTITTTGVRLYLTGANAGATPVAAAIGFHWKAEGR